MQQPKTPPSKNDRQSDQLTHTKKTWHRPSLNVVSLRATAFEVGSPIDGSTSGSSK